jgi:NO-binding membrane sensor protein with MHYT domain
MVHQFAYGWITPALAYALSFVGSLLGLVATSRARAASTNQQRARWLALAACALGGTGIWTMHFLAMAGFAVDGTTIRYDVPITVASWLTAVIVVGIGLFLVGFGRPSIFKVIPAGVLTGVGVAGMHYSGMAAMRLGGHLDYDRRYVIASVVIAVVAATVALWFSLTVRRPIMVIGSAALMALAVSSMHYTGMYGVHVHPSDNGAPRGGTDPTALLLPILVLAIVMIVALFYALLGGPSSSDRDVQDELRARINGSHPDTRPARYEPAANSLWPAEPAGPDAFWPSEPRRRPSTSQPPRR